MFRFWMSDSITIVYKVDVYINQNNMKTVPRQTLNFFSVKKVTYI